MFNVYKERRLALAQQLPPHSIAMVPAATEKIRNGDCTYRFRQDSDFYYLTGFDEPDALLLVTSGPRSQSILFNRARHASEEQWTGRRLGPEDAVGLLGVDAAFALDELESRLPEFMLGIEQMYYPWLRFYKHKRELLQVCKQMKRNQRRGSRGLDAFIDLTSLLYKMRVIKSDDEVALMREAARISVTAHQRVMRRARHARYEHELEAEFLYSIMQEGCRNTAYDSIVAGGSRACTLHYTTNNQALTAGDLLLVDAGAEYQHYAADITRTFPVNGRFTRHQRLIYELVLRAQKAGIAVIKPGVAWDQIQRVMVTVITSGLVELGILVGDVEALIAAQAYKVFYMHSSGHWLGLDVHDAGYYTDEHGGSRLLERGMVLTVEPGLYISPGVEGIDPCWWGIGVRIEDDVWVSTDGAENLTQSLVRDVEAIEDALNA